MRYLQAQGQIEEKTSSKQPAKSSRDLKKEKEQQKLKRLMIKRKQADDASENSSTRTPKRSKSTKK